MITMMVDRRQDRQETPQELRWLRGLVERGGSVTAQELFSGIRAAKLGSRVSGGSTLIFYDGRKGVVPVIPGESAEIAPEVIKKLARRLGAAPSKAAKNAGGRNEELWALSEGEELEVLLGGDSKMIEEVALRTPNRDTQDLIFQSREEKGFKGAMLNLARNGRLHQEVLDLLAAEFYGGKISDIETSRVVSERLATNGRNTRSSNADSIGESLRG